MPNKTYKNQDEKRLYLALGPSISEALVDPHVTEIMLNPDGRLFFDIHIEGMCEAGFMDAATAQTLIMTIAGLVKLSATVPLSPQRSPMIARALKDYYRL